MLSHDADAESDEPYLISQSKAAAMSVCDMYATPACFAALLCNKLLPLLWPTGKHLL